ncbi:helix-turn-helix domain-containing protein [Lysinibacillus fusiformis]|uniref:helix-turn-helix domain-containing protein n=1 Tax=Lysinibacillus fusiformis TaxID=28031 RepID=UPI00148CB678|nr:helix-turn-helix transcriptional regulator [Lysinibacillus fusiformis]NOG29063.1 helix-turn-helix transcriptional regulator [Lysinibacillus fusiformis]
MDITKKVKRLLVESDMNATQLAEKIETTQSNLSRKMKNESYSVTDLIKIAEALNVKLEINFIMEDGTKI